MAHLLDAELVGFLLHDWLDLPGLLARDEYAHLDVEAVDAVLELSRQIAEGSFAPHGKISDSREPQIGPDGVTIPAETKAALREYAEAGLFAAGFAEKHGGHGLPFLVTSASFAWMAAGNIATSAFPMLTAANARLITAFGSPAQIESFALPEIEGRFFGTMCLSEPQAGSDLGVVATRATPDGEDELGRRYRIAGSKMWISGGEHDAAENIVHLVLAKVAGPDGALPAGTAGLSLFIVPRVLPDGARNDIAVAGLNHKMGYRGIPNCLLAFGENEGATGWLVGEEGRGLRQMFMMMNEARISVGIGAAALGCRGLAHSIAYAQERAQGRAPDGRAGGQSVAIIEHADVRRMILAQKALAEGALALDLYAARLVDTEDEADNAALLALLTPVVKTFSSEMGLEANSHAIQIHGGYGYTRDFDVEQLWRDNRLNPIHEGTTGIQAIDLLARKLLAGGEGLAALKARIAATLERAGPIFMAEAKALRGAWQQVDDTLAHLSSLPRGDALAVATPFLFAFGHAVVGWIWLDLAAAGQGGSPRTAAGTQAALRYYTAFELPRIGAWLASCRAGGDALALDPAAL